MISFAKVLFFSLYCSMLTVFTDGARESINQNGGGSGGGSNGRGQNQAVSGSSSTRPSSSSSNNLNIASPIIASPTPNTPSLSNQQDSINFNSGNNDNNNSGGTSSFIGTTGTLADRERPVTCPICMAVPNNVYNENLLVDVGSGDWTCGYIQETVQDVNMNSQWEIERNNCRNAQFMAEQGGCCAQTMFINGVGEDIHDPCDLCGSNAVPSSKVDYLVDTRVVGKHTCSGLDMVMKQRIFSANICDAVKTNIGGTCCSSGTATVRTASLRGGVADVDSAVP